MKKYTLNLKDRLISVDVLRGLAMFLILAIDIGGAPIFRTFVNLWGENFASLASEQFSYGFTEGLRLSFIAMPMFLFVVGVVIPFSLSNRILKTGKKRVYLHIIKRALILVLLGFIAGGNLLLFDMEKLRILNNVLQYIGIGYLICAILVMNTTILVQFIITAALLLFYWAMFLFIPVPGWEGEIFSSEMNLAKYIDRIILGSFQRGNLQVFANISYISNMLLGVLIGQIIFSNRNQESKTKLLFICGLAMLLAGSIWGMFYPIIRSLWTGSFVLVTCGISTLLLASFYLITDVWKYSKWAFFFVVFGANSIAIYMMAHLFDFRLIGNILVGGLSSFFTSNVQDFIQAVTAMVIMWLIMYYMYRKKTFIKI